MTKRSNEYAQLLGRDYAQIPKAVFAAVAMSCCGSGLGLVSAKEKFFEEWQTLFDNGVVAQKPRRKRVPNV